MAQSNTDFREPIFSPLNIKVLLHFYVFLDQYPNRDPASRESIARLIQEGALEDNDMASGHYHITKKGKAWVAALCNVPCPRVAFVDEQGRILEV